MSHREYKVIIRDERLQEWLIARLEADPETAADPCKSRTLANARHQMERRKRRRAAIAHAKESNK